MDRRTFLSGAGAASLAPMSSSAALPQTEAASLGSGRPPNIVYILFDKCRRDAFGCYDLRKVHTPNIDRMASQGVRFDNCYTPQALCAPARASILTGAFPHAHRLQRNPYPSIPGQGNSTYQEAIPDPFRDTRFQLWDNFAQLLNASGYATAHIGKWHLGEGNPGFFDYWKSFNSLLLHWIGEPHKSRYRPDVHTEQGVRFIERHKDEPFLLYQSYYAPHAPYDPPKEYLEHYPNEEHAGYYGSVSNLDWNVGRIVAALEEQGILDETLLIIGTEHGTSWVDRPGTVEGLCTSYDETSRIPLVMRYPRLLPQGKVWNAGVSLVDIMPTILEAAGVRAETGTVETNPFPLLQGRSLIGDIRAGNDRWDRPIVVENVPQAAIDGAFFDERALRTEHYKLIMRKFHSRPQMRPGELYDLRSDPDEKRNLYKSPTQRAVLTEMATTLEEWGQKYDDDVAIELGAWASRA